MFAAKQLKPLFLAVPGIGECTLLPMNLVPAEFRSYERMLATAQGLDLTEFDVLSLLEIQLFFKALSFALSERGVSTTESISVMLSGTHLAYPKIDIGIRNQQMEQCVTTMQFFFWNDALLVNGEALLPGPIDMQIDEIPIDERIDNETDDVTYCLFIGTADCFLPTNT